MKISNEEILLINALQNFSGVTARDCIISTKNILFVVNEKDVGNAIGKKGEKINKLKQKLKKNIEIYGYTEKPENFIKNSLREIKINEITEQDNEGKKIFYLNLDSENKRKIFTQTGKLKKIKELLKRNYKIDDIKIK
ncbi:MAG: NusA-like transcription termination signal-binding factor [Candidatus Diapherotrites archaeon CG10_big_fil_rev_8_21_14_0_10_31_34]|nr:MAG: NusA-like transcription termination signal-binding factor [Candidatus Diapherotrites archaeon CG10_big_fil_rev_8_21_14_0_10_31_34]